MRADISSFTAMILDVFSSLFYVAYISLCASIDLVRSVWSKPDILLSVHEVVEEVRDSSIECVRFVIPYLTLPRVALAWARTTKDWAGARVIARRMQMQADPIIEANVPEVVEPQATANAERKTVAFSSLPDFIPCVDPSPSPSPSIPFKFDFNFAKRRDVPAFFGSPNSTSGAKSPLSLSESKKEGSAVRSKSNSPRHRLAPSPPSTIPFPDARSIHPQSSFEYYPRYPRYPAMYVPLLQPHQPYLQADFGMAAVNEDRARAIERLRLAMATREQNFLMAQQFRTRNPTGKAAGLGLLLNQPRTPTKALQFSYPLRVKQEETPVSLEFNVKENHAPNPSPKVSSPPPAHKISKKPNSKSKEQAKPKDGQTQPHHGRRRGPRFFRAAKADAAAKKSKKNQKAIGDVVPERKKSASTQQAGFKSDLRATAPEFVMRKTLNDKTNA
ncbi:hypothetical protein SCHPADRAFT_383551 [Schizopora paradoxa]|uniref:Uncharacterized protein n=1 Tax=Schizopora paradoxa TaxID=27342 RepID=A0A0H2RUI6_9AGAM|nr:hypothetical protein SCHPADRAFT_383551 [Schizopora paradoxa]